MKNNSLSWQESRQAQRGFTLIEALMALAVLGIVTTSALPSLGRLIENRHLENAASQAATDLQFARSEAVLRNQQVRLSVQTHSGGDACYVIHTGKSDGCKCQAKGPAVCEGDAEPIKTVAFDAARGIGLQANVASIAFDPAFGTASPAGTISIKGAKDRSVNHVVNVMGRIRSCSPQAAVAGYKAC